MAKFDAGKEVEALEYDFTAYGGTAGPIKEPSTGRVNGFFANMKEMFRNVKDLQGNVEVNTEDMSDEEMSAALNRIDEASEAAAEYQSQTVEALAYLCGADWEEQDGNEDGTQNPRVLVGGSPTYAELEVLPYRVLQAFTSWLIEEIKPKKTTPGTKG